MTDDEKKELELLFIEEELSQHGEWLADVLTEAIEKRKLRRTDDLLHSVNYSAFKEGKKAAAEDIPEKTRIRGCASLSSATGVRSILPPTSRTGTRWTPCATFGGRNRTR